MHTARSSSRPGGCLHQQLPQGVDTPREQTPPDETPHPLPLGADTPPGSRHPPEQTLPSGRRHSPC